MSFNYNFNNLNPEDPGYAGQYDPSKSLIQPDQTIDPKKGRVGSGRRTTEDIVEDLYKKKIPEPVFDQDKADRLQRMGKLNQVGRSLNVLGDIFGTAIGANTRRRQPDTTAPALYQSYQANLDKYKAEKDQNLLRDYDKDRQDILHQISRADRQEGIDINQKRFEAQQKYKEAQQKLEWQKYLAGLTYKEREIAIKEEKAKRDAAYQQAKINKTTGSVDKSNQPVIIKTAKKTYTLTPSEASYTRGKAIENIDLLKKKYPTWTVTVPKLDEWNEVIPGEFTTKLDPRVKDDDLIRAQKQLDEEDEELKNSTGSKTKIPAPKTTRKIDYSKIY